jgi:hypothetical protein
MRQRLSECDFMYQHNVLEFREVGHNDCAAYGCDDEGICRCYVIDEVHLYDINLRKLRNFILKSIGMVRGRDLGFAIVDDYNEMNPYCVDRIIHKYKLWTQEAWRVDWGGDYYGESVFSIGIANADEIEGHIWAIYTMENDIDKLKYVLNLEYGHILPEIDGSELVLDIVETKDVILSSRNRKEALYSFIEKDDIYGDYDLARAVCYEKNGKFVAVDGYTRMSANKDVVSKIIIVKK